KEVVRETGNPASRAAPGRGGARRVQNGIIGRARAADLQHDQRVPQHRVIIEDRRRLCLSIAGLGVAIESAEPDLDIQPQGAIGRFAAADVACDLTVRTGWTDVPMRHDEPPMFDSGAVWRLYRAGDHFLFDFTSSICGPVPYKTARVNSAFSAAGAQLHRPFLRTRRPAA